MLRLYHNAASGATYGLLPTGSDSVAVQSLLQKPPIALGCVFLYMYLSQTPVTPVTLEEYIGSDQQKRE